MSVTLPEKTAIIEINTTVIQNSTDPNEDKDDAGKFNNEGMLDSAYTPYLDYQDAFDAAYGFAKAIACNHVFLNGNKRTATITAVKICNDNGYSLKGNMSSLIKLVNDLVKEDSDDDDYETEKKFFIDQMHNLFT